jgi:hypothetical protein
MYKISLSDLYSIELDYSVYMLYVCAMFSIVFFSDNNFRKIIIIINVSAYLRVYSEKRS